MTDQPFNISELEHALHRKEDTAPGKDEYMIRQSPIKLQFLKLCNPSWDEGKLPKKWKATKLFPIPKNDVNFRLISLITVMSKVCKKMVLNRLRWNAQPVNIFSLGFRNKIGTQDAIVVSHITEGDAYRKKHSAALKLIDIEKAFEMTSPTVVLYALAANAGIGGKMLSWIHNFLSSRTGAVRFHNEYSSSMTFQNGTLQGSCLSPTLFSYLMNRLLNLKLTTSVQLVAYVDDLSLSCCHPDISKVIKNIQTVIDSINAEATLGMKFSHTKSKAMWFYTTKPNEVITLNDQRLPWSPNEKYLGVNLTAK